MQLKRRKPFLSVVLLILALTLLPFGVSTSNPWYTASAPDETLASRILENLLSNTYTSFNIKDENELYSSLSETVTSTLIDDLYLDSRRRLNSGLREGSVVEVLEVEVMNTDTPRKYNGAQSGYTYPIEWMVTARVRHLQHVHFRQNRYVGDITIGVEVDQWKISNITLKSEDRKVIAAFGR